MQKELTTMRDKATRRRKAFRERATTKAMKRKEEFLGARVPKELRDQVVQRANELGMPVSILIRNILEQAIHSPRPGEGGAGPTSALGAVAGHVPAAQDAGRFPSVIGWEDMRLNKSVDCALCGIRLNPGVSITLGLAGPGEEHVVLCQRCKHAT